MSAENKANLQQLLKGARDEGLVSMAAYDSMNVVDLGQTFQDSLGVDPAAIDATEVFGLFILLDDSSSIRFVAGNTEAVRDGYNLLLDSLMKSQSRDDIIVTTRYMNAGVVQSPVPLPQAARLDSKNYNPSGYTPLYDGVIELCTLATIKHQEFTATGASFRGVIVFITDGHDEGSMATAAKVKPVAESLQQREIFQVLAVGVSDGNTDFRKVFTEMGVLPSMILTPSNDPHSIRDAMGVVSRATNTASQGGSISQSGGLGAFGTTI